LDILKCEKQTNTLLSHLIKRHSC